MTPNGSPDYKKLYLESADDELKRERERMRQTTFMEFICHCHNLFSRPLKVSTPYYASTDTIPLPWERHCPIRLRPWGDCNRQQQAIYDRVCHYLQSNKENPQLFLNLIVLEEFARHLPDIMGSERCLETYESTAVEHNVRRVISELCKIPAAREEFMLGDGLEFDFHENSLNETRDSLTEIDMPNIPRSRLEQFCVRRVEGDTGSLLLTLEYKSAYKLSVENLRAGLRPIDLWDELVNRGTIPTDPVEKIQYNAEILTASALVQAYDVMIEEGLAYAILTNGPARVLLYVPHDDPATLNYQFCDPNTEIVDDAHSLQQPMTSVARELCLCLMSFRSPVRNQEWRNLARSQTQLWKTTFSRIRSLIPKEELRKSPQSKNVTPSPASSASDNQPSSPLDVSTAGRQHEIGDGQNSKSRQHATPFCTQRCLLALRNRRGLDDACPNVALHRQGESDRHPITSEDLILSLKTQLDENIDRCTPIGHRGTWGAPFKLTCLEYGYTVFGKGTTSDLWKEVSREAQAYQILRKAQGSAVPVFLGTIDLAKIYFRFRAG
ncbi:unnamed protein product [Penicillium bialowiezense]